MTTFNKIYCPFCKQFTKLNEKMINTYTLAIECDQCSYQLILSRDTNETYEPPY